MSRKKGDNLSKIRLAEKYRDPNAHVYWMTGVPERIKISFPGSVPYPSST